MDDFVHRLKQWGHATVARHARQMDGRSHGDHILSKHKELAPGTREKAEKVLLARSGISRRRRMAESAGVAGMEAVPVWCCDPIPARNDADRPHDNPQAFVDIGLPDDVLPVDDAIRSLERQPNGRLQAMVVKEEYTGVGSQQAKCSRVANAYGGRLTLNQYRHELKKAKLFLRGRVAR